MDLRDFKKAEKHDYLQDRPVMKPAVKMGRPRKEQEKKLSKKITFNATPAEKNILYEKADEMGISVTNLIRGLLKKHGCL